MKGPPPAVVLLILAFAGCADNSHTITQPRRSTTVHISGTVTMPDGSPVWMARVVADSLNSTYTDRNGIYGLVLPLSSKMQMLYAADGYTPGESYTAIHFASVASWPDSDRTVNLVLTNTMLLPTAGEAQISGRVTMPDGSAVWMAKVVAGTQDSTFTDPDGSYHFALPLASDSLTFFARNGYTPGVAYIEISFGSVKVCPDRSRIVNIMLTHHEPI